MERGGGLEVCMDAIGRGRRESVVRTMAALAGLLVGVAGCAEQETPDLNGIWQTPSSAHWNVEPHAAHAGPGTAPDALTAARGGLGIVEGGDIPYQPWARVRQQEHFRDRGALDPLRNCYLPGVPRANYLPYPLQIVQTPTHVLIAYEFAQASRTVYLDRPDFEAPIDGWMGHSLGAVGGRHAGGRCDRTAAGHLARSGGELSRRGAARPGSGIRWKAPIISATKPRSRIRTSTSGRGR